MNSRTRPRACDPQVCGRARPPPCVAATAGDVSAGDVICPAGGPRRPVSASISSRLTISRSPAIPMISPARTSSETPSHRLEPRSRPRSGLHFRAASPGWAGGLRRWRTTSRPTIMRARLAPVAPARGTRVHPPPLSQHRDPVRRCRAPRAACALMKMIALPSLPECRMIVKSSFASCGVSTAVGSSRISVSAPR